MLDVESHPLGEGGFGAVYKATYQVVCNDIMIAFQQVMVYL